MVTFYDVVKTCSNLFRLILVSVHKYLSVKVSITSSSLFCRRTLDMGLKINPKPKICLFSFCLPWIRRREVYVERWEENTAEAVFFLLEKHTFSWHETKPSRFWTAHVFVLIDDVWYPNHILKYLPSKTGSLCIPYYMLRTYTRAL